MTETISAPGRVTWHGICATEGCDKTVYAKRVPKDVRPPEAEGAQTPPEPDETAVREVRFDVPQPKRGRGEPRLPQQQPEPEPEGAAGDQQPPAVRADTVVAPLELGDQQQPEPAPGGGNADLVDRRSRNREPRPRRSFRHPLDW